jgi:hypothetical protein
VIRSWDELVASIDDVISLPLAVLLLFVAAALVAVGWFFWPRWLPWNWSVAAVDGADRSRRRRRWRWPKLRWPRWRWRRRRREGGSEGGAPEPELVPHDTDGLPDLSSDAFLVLADRLAAAGRYAEAVRERLRAIVRELVEAGVIGNRPGWTVTELARAAGYARPPVQAPLDAASLLFSDLWYGERPATAEHDARMRQYAVQVHAALTAVPPAPGAPAPVAAGMPR